jgi:hypothetical protein
MSCLAENTPSLLICAGLLSLKSRCASDGGCFAFREVSVLLTRDQMNPRERCHF